MQLKIQRSQRMGGVFAGTVVFSLDVRADYTEEERHNINKYRLGPQIIYNSQAARRHLDRAGAHLDRTQSGSAGERAAGLARGALSMAMAKMSLNISIASLGRGHHIECKDLEELLEAEDTVREACKNVTRYLEAAATFDGSETVIEYDKGEERIHMIEHAPALLEYQEAPPHREDREYGGVAAYEAYEAEERARTQKPPRDWAKDWAEVKDALAAAGRWTRDTALPAIEARWVAYEANLLDWTKERGLGLERGPFRLACMSAAGILVSALFLWLIW